MKKVIKIKIGMKDTVIWYTKKHFKNRIEVIKFVISHLQNILKKV